MFPHFRGFTPVPGSIMAVAANQETGRVLVQLTDRTLLVYDENADLFVPFCDKDDREIMFPLSCAQMAFCNFGGEVCIWKSNGCSQPFES